jgi:hypothetical protein
MCELFRDIYAGLSKEVCSDREEVDGFETVSVSTILSEV